MIWVLGFLWVIQDFFIFCVYYNDCYLKGNVQLGFDVFLGGCVIGQDFDFFNDWWMYYGKIVFGFLYYFYSGFEMVIIGKKGLIDYVDFLGVVGCFGNGDVQWMIVGKGVQYFEMFLFLCDDVENLLELF